MPRRSSPLVPTGRALEFGRQYAVVLQRWSELFAAAAALAEANVRLGELAAEAAGEFDDWVERAREAAFAWASPDAFRQFMEAFGQGTPRRPDDPS
ncbi:MAG: hypothetical protein KatS3mg062_1245 [Tepidiforma sp.]|nr:MAG: hypothetical protein KatS3mg062_1245 [Tepidiforma sp.]